MTSTHKARLQKVCRVLFPKYRYLKVNNMKQTAMLTKSKWWLIAIFFPRWRVSLNELINLQIPSQLADFKYGNKTFINVIQEDLVRCELSGHNKIDYFLDEITKVKYVDIYKQLNISPSEINLTPVPNEEDEMFEGMVEHYREQERDKYITPVGRALHIYNSPEIMFYIALFIIVAFVILRSIKM